MIDESYNINNNYRGKNQQRTAQKFVYKGFVCGVDGVDECEQEE